MTASPSPGTVGPLTVLVDDVRSFRDGRPALIARSSAAGVTLLDSLTGEHIDDLWLDHDLAGDDTIAPVIRRLVECAAAGEPRDVGMIHIQASRIGPAHKMWTMLQAAGYRVQVSYAAGMWVRGV